MVQCEKPRARRSQHRACIAELDLRPDTQVVNRHGGSPDDLRCGIELFMLDIQLQAKVKPMDRRRSLSF